MDNPLSQVQPETDQNYTVVARRYRPKTFSELIGQDHIAQALKKAIETGRVGHAYLFTGARGVGKTSTARIFAKALSVDEGSQTLAADIAQAIDAGDDMDVIEIDGASNRGIEEIRQLRANVNVRPSRAHFKIYIIDEVHMLTTQAFNALLKTLEEPPAHVKFIFCTTDPDKIPITVLSRCQRFDFAPVKFEAIQLRLQEISQAEGYQVAPEALALLARRAAGSMRDSQSLLEQVMSFATDTISVEQVHALLGTADEGRLLAIAKTLCDKDALAAINLVDQAMQGGADPGQLAEQLLNYLRDIMAVGLGGGPHLLKIANPLNHQELVQLANRWGVQSVLSAIQILDESLVRMRSSVSATTLLEVALVQVCQLEKLASIPALLEAVQQGLTQAAPAARPAALGEKKNDKLAETPAALPGSAPPSSVPPSHLRPAAAESQRSSVPPLVNTAVRSSARHPEPTSQQLNSDDIANTRATNQDTAPVVASPLVATDSAARVSSQVSSSSLEPAEPIWPTSTPQVAASHRRANSPSAQALADWQRAVSTIDGMLADFASLAVAVEPHGSDRWTILFPPAGSKPFEYCEQGQRPAQLQSALQATLGRKIQLAFAVQPGEAPKPAMAAPQAAIRAQRIREVSDDPYIKQVREILDGEILRVDPPPQPGFAKSQTAPANRTVS